MTSKTVALREAAKIRAKGKKAKAVLITRGLGPGVKEWMVQSSPKKKRK